jgi:prophage regulatory protein
MTKLIRMKQVREIISLSPTTIYRKIATGDFPKQLKLTDKTCAWVEQEVLDWVDAKIAQRDNC